MKVPLQLSLLYCVNETHSSNEDCETSKKFKYAEFLGFFMFSIFSQFFISKVGVYFACRSSVWSLIFFKMASQIPLLLSPIDQDSQLKFSELAICGLRLEIITQLPFVFSTHYHCFEGQTSDYFCCYFKFAFLYEFR